jgi:uncharacterized membrane protein (UPF0127 family)
VSAREVQAGGRARRAIGSALALALACAISFALACGRAGGADADAPEAWMTINGQRVALELSITPAQQQLGLGRRDGLAWNHGMLFLYERPGFPRFWMKDMRFDIDIVWIRDGRVVDISHRVPHVPGGNGPTVQPSELADSVLEVPAGYAQAHGWRAGQTTLLERP